MTDEASRPDASPDMADDRTEPIAAEGAGGDPARTLRRLTRRAFATGAVAAAAGFAGWRWLAARPREGGLPWPYRRALEANERLWSAVFDPERPSPTFPVSAIDPPRANGRLGLEGTVDRASWRLRVVGVAGADGPVELSFDDVVALDRHDQVTELRCIEGWSMIAHWSGARLADLIARFPPPTRDGSPPDPIRHPERLVRYVALETPDRGYYVGLDMASALHPQTLLAYGLNGRLLSRAHGAPVRLAIPVKYGIKNLKRIGTLRYTDVRPADYWAERGYDWYAGH